MTKPRKSYYKPAAMNKPVVDPAVRQCAVTISFMTPSEIRDRSWVSYGTARNIINGKTRRPQHLTLAGLLRAAGFEFTIQKKER